MLFQSTQPEWAATESNQQSITAGIISIHAARVGCDALAAATSETNADFNPRSPSGLRHAFLPPQFLTAHYFNPRSPSGLRRKNSRNVLLTAVISIHAARVGCDSLLIYLLVCIIDFNPRSPSGLRHSSANKITSQFVFQSTQPEWAATLRPSA